MLAVALSVFMPTALSPARADISGGVNSQGVTVTLDRSDLTDLNGEYRRLMAKTGPHWKYRSAPAGCDVGGLGSTSTCLDAAVAACVNNTPAEGRGPLVDVFRRWVDEDGDTLSAAEWPSEPLPGANGWALVGSTCLPNLVPGADPVPTIEMVVEAFHQTRGRRAGSRRSRRATSRS